VPVALLATARLRGGGVDAVEHIARLNCRHGVRQRYKAHSEPTASCTGILTTTSVALLYANNLGVGAFNGIVVAGDSGIIYSKRTTGTGNFVIAPQNGTAGGLRIDNNGTTTLSRLVVTNGITQGGGIKTARFVLTTPAAGETLRS
jgi:hypothetical protein